MYCARCVPLLQDRQGKVIRGDEEAALRNSLRRNLLQALQQFAAGGTQVIVFTHHQHLVEVAQKACGGSLGVIQLG